MNKRLLMYIMLYVLFAVSQTGIAMHEVTHINPDTSQSQSDDEDQNAAEEHCDRCISQADTDTADLPQAFTVPSKTLQSIIATIPVARLVSRLVNTYSARAPPAA